MSLDQSLVLRIPRLHPFRAAFFHPAFKVALLIFCRERGLAHPGFLILDTPLLTYRDPLSNRGPLEGDEEELRKTALKQYFFECAKRAGGAQNIGSRFIAITDPGSQLEKIAERDKFRHIAHGIPSVGGRYSVLSDFGLVPAATMGT